jgi:hypothetical protein
MSILLSTFQYEGIFEAHISVAPLQTHQTTWFQDFCQEHQCKAILIVLSRGDSPLQPMSCSRHQGTLQSVMQEVKQLAEAMQNAGFEVKRIKIEASPQNKDIPANDVAILEHPAENYFEHHWKILLEGEPSEALFNLCEQFKAHFSKNAFKQREDKQFEHFITLRLYGKGWQETQAICLQFGRLMEQQNIPILHQITEYCVYDDYLALDAHWLDTASACLQCSTPCLHE